MKNLKRILALTLVSSSLSGSLSIYAMRPENTSSVNSEQFNSEDFLNYYKKLKMSLDEKDDLLLQGWLDRVQKESHYELKDYEIPPIDYSGKILQNILNVILTKSQRLYHQLLDYGNIFEYCQFKNVSYTREKNINLQDDRELELLRGEILENFSEEKKKIPFHDLFESISKIYKSLKVLQEEIGLLNITNLKIEELIDINLNLLSKLNYGLNLFKNEDLPLSTFEYMIAFVKEIESNLSNGIKPLLNLYLKD